MYNAYIDARNAPPNIQKHSIRMEHGDGAWAQRQMGTRKKELIWISPVIFSFHSKIQVRTAEKISKQQKRSFSRWRR